MSHAPEIHHVCYISGGEEQGEEDKRDDGADTGHDVDMAIVEGAGEIF